MHRIKILQAVNYSKQLVSKDKEILKLRNLLATKDGELAAKHEELTHLQRECIELMEGKVRADEEKNDDAERKLEEEEEAVRNPSGQFAGRNPLDIERNPLLQHAGRSGTSLREMGHAPMPVDTADRFYCVVCKLEENWRKEDGLRDPHGRNARSQKNMCICSKKDCQLVCHAIPMGHERKIFDIEGLRGLSCFEVAHSDMCKGLWVCSERAGQLISKSLHPNDPRNKCDSVTKVKQRLPSYSLKRTHPVYKHLQEAYGRGREKRRRRTKNMEDIENDDEDQKEGQILC